MADMKWIPVTERLPEVSGRYLVTLVFKDITVAMLETDFWFFDGKHSPYCPELEVDFDRDINFLQLPEGYTGWCKYSGYDDLGSFVKPWEDATVLAWMPYPEPYNPNN